MNSGCNRDRKNIFVINDNLKSSASKALCLPVFLHAAVRLMCFSRFHMPQCRFGQWGAWLPASRVEFQNRHGRDQCLGHCPFLQLMHFANPSNMACFSIRMWTLAQSCWRLYPKQCSHPGKLWYQAPLLSFQDRKPAKLCFHQHGLVIEPLSNGALKMSYNCTLYFNHHVTTFFRYFFLQGRGPVHSGIEGWWILCLSAGSSAYRHTDLRYA